MEQNSSQVLVNQTVRKKRGPYNKLSRQKLLDGVRELYFEEEYSKVDIAKTLGISRNTVTSYVQYWKDEYEKQGMNDEIKEFFYKENSFLKSLKRKLLKKLKTEPDSDSQNKIYKLLLGLHDRQAKLYLKFSPIVKKSPKISAELVKKIIRELAFEEFSFYEQDELIRRIIYIAECDVETAKSIKSEMEKLGLFYSRDYGEKNYSEKTHMTLLAEMSRCLSEKECSIILKETNQKRKQKLQDCLKSLKEFEEEFRAGYGHAKNWSKEVWKEYASRQSRINDSFS